VGVVVSEPLIFKRLTGDISGEKQVPEALGHRGVVFHVILIGVLILTPLLLPEKISHRQLLVALIAPPPPPPAAPPGSLSCR